LGQSFSRFLGTFLLAKFKEFRKEKPSREWEKTRGTTKSQGNVMQYLYGQRRRGKEGRMGEFANLFQQDKFGMEKDIWARGQTQTKESFQGFFLHIFRDYFTNFISI
jgi:hypothetical protein